MLFKLYLKMLYNLPEINNINYKSINSFNICEKNLNDKTNKIRENIIISIINNKIPNDYYKYSNRWKKLRTNIHNFISTLYSPIYNIKGIIKAGRKNNYDFEISINNNMIFHIEFKFNSLKINKISQFISPMKPSKYLSNSFEDYIYYNYLTKLLNKFNLIIPNKECYDNDIHSTNPKCLKEIQEKYYKGCSSSTKYSGNKEDIEFYKLANKYSKDSIIEFIKNNELDIKKLSEYLKNTQEDKIYMLYYKHNIYKETIDISNYEIISYEKKDNYFIAKTKNGIKLKILLRWKNGNLIAFPAFQISIIGNK
jgi:hypothetical protein